MCPPTVKPRRAPHWKIPYNFKKKWWKATLQLEKEMLKKEFPRNDVEEDFERLNCFSHKKNWCWSTEADKPLQLILGNTVQLRDCQATRKGQIFKLLSCGSIHPNFCESFSTSRIICQYLFPPILTLSFQLSLCSIIPQYVINYHRCGVGWSVLQS